MNVDWWSLLSAAFGAVVGAAASAVPAFYLARRSSKEMLERDRTSRSEQQKIATLRATTKLLLIVNGIETLHRMFEQAISDSDAGGQSHMALWQKIRSIIGPTGEKIRFEAEEVNVFASAGDFDYVNDLFLVAERYDALRAGLKKYSARRAALLDQLPAVMSGTVGTVELTPEDRKKFEPRAVELEVLITQLRQQAAEYGNDALSIAEQFGPKIRLHLKDPNYPMLNVSEARLRRDGIKS